MNAKEAVAKRITDLCSEREITVNAVANKAGISPSTIYSMLKNPSTVLSAFSPPAAGRKQFNQRFLS